MGALSRIPNLGVEHERDFLVPPGRILASEERPLAAPTLFNGPCAIDLTGVIPVAVEWSDHAIVGKEIVFFCKRHIRWELRRVPGDAVRCVHDLYVLEIWRWIVGGHVDAMSAFPVIQGLELHVEIDRIKTTATSQVETGFALKGSSMYPPFSRG